MIGFEDRRAPAATKIRAHAVTVQSVGVRNRLRDVLVLQGPPLMGLAFAWRPDLLDRLSSVLVFVIANLCLVAHVFSVTPAWNRRRRSIAAQARLAARGLGQRRPAWTRTR